MQDGRFGPLFYNSCEYNSALSTRLELPASGDATRRVLRERGLDAVRRMFTDAPCGKYACADLSRALHQAR